MLDTVILNLQRGTYRITIPERFTPSASLLNQPGHYLLKCVNNPTKQDKESGFYYPRLTIIKRPTKIAYDISLKIEFSAPKLLFNNNLDELSENDFEEVVKTLRQRLAQMGVVVEEDILKQANVSAFHASKNISITGGYTASYVIKELNKVNLTKKLDLNKSDFRNEGQSMQFYANSHSFVMYDKLRDFGKKKSRAIDKDCTDIQLDLLKKIRAENPRAEIIRLEARLSKKVKMNSTLAELGYRKNPKFADIFNVELNRKIILSYWQPIVSNNAFLFDISSNPQKTLRAILRHAPKMKPKQAIFLVGLAALSKDKDGIRTLRVALEGKADKRTWFRIAHNYQILNSINSYANKAEWLKQINKGLKDFNSYNTYQYDNPTKTGHQISAEASRAYSETIPTSVIKKHKKRHTSSQHKRN